MTIKIAHSSASSPQLALDDLRSQLGDRAPKFVLVFASPKYDPTELGAALAKYYEGVASIGCTTSGELVSGQMLEGSVVMATFDENAIEEAYVQVIDDPTSEESIRGAADRLAKAAGAALSELSPDQYLGLVLQDGIKASEERVMAHLSALTNVAFVGGSAGDDLKFVETVVYGNCRPHPGATVLALLKPKVRFSILKTQSFDVLDHVLEVTEVDEGARRVKSFNGRPAAEAYAAELNVKIEDLPGQFQSHPVGLVMSDGEPFVRSPQRIEGSDVFFYCEVKPGMKLHVLRSGNMIQDTKRDLEGAIDRLGGCSTVINFHCILRTLELRAQNLIEDYGNVFSDVPTIGFSTYGESYIGHINQTSTMVLFSDD